MDEKEVGKNVSSGAEKVESIRREAEKERMAAERRVAEARKRLREKERKNQGANHQDDSEKHRSAQGGQGQSKKGSQRGDGLGGWIAAVVSLGVVSLALTAVVTVGAIKMKEERASTAAAYRGTMYEVIHIVEEVDDDFEALRISNDPAKQAEILTDILVKTRLAEADLEKLPVDGRNYTNTMRFFNFVSMHSERMLDKLSRGERLNEQDQELFAALYETDHKIRGALDELAATMEDDDMAMLLRDKENRIQKTMETVENNALPKIPKPKKPQEEGEHGKALPSGSKMEERAGISSKKAEEYCKRYFADYRLEQVRYAGETIGKGLKTYNFEMKTEDGVGMFAQISQENGALVYFDYYQECKDHTHDIETVKNMAVAFLQKLGYEDMIPVKVSESGTNADFTFAYTMDGCTYYPDEIVVKVCEERGVVSGFDASKYLKNHRGRDATNVELTMQEAKDGLSDKLTVEACRQVVFTYKGREMNAYEFFGSYDGQTYFVYVDAMDGRELFIVNSKNR